MLKSELAANSQATGSLFQSLTSYNRVVTTRAANFTITNSVTYIQCKVKGKGKCHPKTGHEGPEEEKRFRPTLSLASVLDGVGG
jgi:hypothetical protein